MNRPAIVLLAIITVVAFAHAEKAGVDLDRILTPEQTEECLATVTEAGAWPDAWLIVQDGSIDEDLVIHLKKPVEDGRIKVVEHFMTPRVDWDAAALKNAYRARTGKKLRGRSLNIVIQGFSTRTETIWVYEDTAEDDGLLALLPEDSILREARSIDLGDGARHTLAVVLTDPRFRPADCSDCRGRTFGHSDTGQINLVLAGEQEIVSILDITPYLFGYGEEPLLPRFVCMEGDPTGEPETSTVEEWFHRRTPVNLLNLVDHDLDGRRLELVLPAAYVECGHVTELVVGVDPASKTLRTY